MFVSAKYRALQSRDRKGAVACLALAALSLVSVGCSRLDMQDQPKFKAQGTNDFFVDARDGRPELEGTIARGQLNEDTAYYEGKDATGNDLAAFPVAVDKTFLERGHQRYDIYCSPCHGRLGNGLGMVVQRGFKQPPSYHIDRLRNAPVGHFFDVITNGYGAMLNYSQQIQVRDRWAIVAYIRVLQYSQNASVNDLPTEARAQLPAPGQAVSPEMKNAMQAEPMVPVDKDFMNFPSEPATPAGVPGAMGAGAANGYTPGQPEKK